MLVSKLLVAFAVGGCSWVNGLAGKSSKRADQKSQVEGN